MALYCRHAQDPAKAPPTLFGSQAQYEGNSRNHVLKDPYYIYICMYHVLSFGICHLLLYSLRAISSLFLCGLLHPSVLGDPSRTGSYQLDEHDLEQRAHRTANRVAFRRNPKALVEDVLHGASGDCCRLCS